MKESSSSTRLLFLLFFSFFSFQMTSITRCFYKLRCRSSFHICDDDFIIIIKWLTRTREIVKNDLFVRFKREFQENGERPTKSTCFILLRLRRFCQFIVHVAGRLCEMFSWTWTRSGRDEKRRGYVDVIKWMGNNFALFQWDNLELCTLCVRCVRIPFASPILRSSFAETLWTVLANVCL